MSYLEKIRHSREKSHHSGVASHILTLMDKLRDDATQNSARRWVWELLQNAKDVALEATGVAIEITTSLKSDQSYLEFAHNGQVFSVDNITFLIEQNSTKDRTPLAGEPPKTTGKFGTGFLTTHLLSEKVNVSGVMKEPDLPHQQFEMVLDRSGRDIPMIRQSVESSIELLERLVSQPSSVGFVPDPSRFNTKFKYQLDGEGAVVANLGLADLHRSIPFVMAFNPAIKLVGLPQESTMYSLGMIKPLSESLSIVEVKKIKNGQMESIQIAMAVTGKAIIAIIINAESDQVTILPFDSDLPRLFCDFPLVGTHSFPFPVVLNSSFFNPTEPRDGVTLLEKEDHRYLENKEILQDGLMAYKSLLHYASANNWKGLYNIVSTALPDENLTWVSREWYQRAIQEPLRDFLVEVPLIDHPKLGRVPLQMELGKLVSIPFHARGDEELRVSIREQLWSLCADIFFILPPKDEIHAWSKVIWAEKFHLNLDYLMHNIDKLKDINGLSNALEADQSETWVWLNNLAGIISQDPHSVDLLNKDTYDIIPNQNGKFVKRTSLFNDQGIEDELKTVLNMLGHDWREFLVHKSFNTISGVTYSSKDQDMAVTQINAFLKNEQIKNRREAVNYLISCFSNDSAFPATRHQMYKVCKDLFGDEIPEKRYMKTWSESIWEQVDIFRFVRVVEEISDKKDMLNLGVKLSLDSNEKTLAWLHDFVAFLAQSQHSGLLSKPILPDQNGNFKSKDELWLDNGEIDEVLKDIAAILGYDCRAEMLDKAIFLDLPQNRGKTPIMIASEISRLITPLLAVVPRPETTREVAGSLFSWFLKNPQRASDTFPELYPRRHRLYDDEQIAANMLIAEKYGYLLGEKNMTFEDLERLLNKKNIIKFLEEEENEQPKPIIDIQILLIQLGISSQEALTQALKDQAIARRFSHISAASFEMFEKVQMLLERAKENVYAYLCQQMDYDCSGWTVVGKTVIQGVIKRNQSIRLVIRPSDGGQVIFYYSEEKDTLELPDAELWVENGVNIPQHLTLGKILKRNSINRIDV